MGAFARRIGSKNHFSDTLLAIFDLCIDDHGSLVIFESGSVRPKHLFDQNFDHDYFFKLPLQGAGCPIKWTTLYFAPCPVPSCPAYEPNSGSFLPSLSTKVYSRRGGPALLCNHVCPGTHMDGFGVYRHYSVFGVFVRHLARCLTM
jgi:hypothetical protein